MPIALAVSTLLWPQSVLAQSAESAGVPDPERARSFVGAHVFDGVEFVKRDLHVVDGRFVAAAPQSAKTVDLGELYVIPPLADAHNHRFHSADDATAARRMFLEAGVFYVANVCCPLDARDTTSHVCNRHDGVDVAFSFGAWTCTEGHPVGLYRRLHAMWEKPEDTFRELNADSSFFEVDCLEELEAKWPILASAKPDLVKIVLNHSRHHDPESAHRPGGLAPRLVPEVVRRARRLGLRVVAHVETGRDFRTAVEGGCSAVVHMPGYNLKAPPTGEKADRLRIAPEDAARAAELGVAVMPTIGLGAPTKGVLRFQAANLETLLDAGVRILNGSDRWMSVEGEWHRVGRANVMDRDQLLRCLCVETPRWIFPQRKIGALAPGFEANFLVLETDPLVGDGPLQFDICRRVKQGRDVTP